MFTNQMFCGTLYKIKLHLIGTFTNIILAYSQKFIFNVLYVKNYYFFFQQEKRKFFSCGYYDNLLVLYFVKYLGYNKNISNAFLK